MQLLKQAMKILMISPILFAHSACTHISGSGPQIDLSSDRHVAEIIKSGLVTCFPQGTLKENGKPSTCEASAAGYINGKVIVVSDKDVSSPFSSFFEIDASGFLDSQANVQVDAYLSGPFFSGIRKVEDMAVDHSKGQVFVTSGFDRIKKSSHEWDSYNTLLTFQADNTVDVRVFDKEISDGYVSSLKLRQVLKDAIGTDYFKVEGLAFFGEGSLLVGIREKGKSYKDFSPVVEVYKISYQVLDGEYLIKGDADLFFKIPNKSFGVARPLSLSSLTFNKDSNSLFVLTSYEIGSTSKDIGGYLWVVNLSEVENKIATPLPIKNRKGDLIEFNHKAEAVTILPDNKVLIVHDDDKVTGEKGTDFYRPLNTFFYSILDFN